MPIFLKNIFALISQKNIVLSQNPKIHFLLFENRQEMKIDGFLADIYPTPKIQNDFFLQLQNPAFKSFEKLKLIKNHNTVAVGGHPNPT